MENTKGRRLFITGMSTAGKSYLAEKLSVKVGGIAVSLDPFWVKLIKSDPYRKWRDFFIDNDEKEYFTKSSDDKQWQDVVEKAEAIWPAIRREIEGYNQEVRPVIFECGFILPHLAKRDLKFPGIVLIGKSYGESLERIQQVPRAGITLELQELETRHNFYVCRPRYIIDAKRYDYDIFETADDALERGLTLLSQAKAR